MLYKVVLAIFLVATGDALKVGPTTTRRMAARAAASAALLPCAVFADLKRAADAELYKRADEGTERRECSNRPFVGRLDDHTFDTF